MKKYKYILPLLKKIREVIWKKLILLLFLTVLISAFELAIPYITKLVFDKGIQEKNIQVFLSLIVFAIVLYILKSLINIVCSKYYAKISNTVIRIIESDLFNRLIRMPLSFFDRYETGYIISRMDEVSNISVLFSPLILKIGISLISFFGAVGMIMFIDYRMLILIVLLVPILYYVSKRNTYQLKASAVELSESAAEKFSELQIDINSIRDIKGLSIEEKREKAYQFYIQNMIEKSIKQNIKTAFGNESILLFAGIADVLTLLFAGILIIYGQLGIGDYIAIVGYMGKVFSPVQQIASLSITIQPALAALARLSFFYDSKVEQEDMGKMEVEKIKQIEFSNVMFSYPKSKKVILKDLSFEIKENEKIIIIGENGTGKSSITNLILGFYKNYQGKILINGIDLKEYDINKYRKKIKIIAQRNFLFPGTIEENIAMGLTDIDKEWLENVIDICDLRETITWAHQCDFKVNREGTNLSGGQIQRIALARAVICKPDVLILDEVNNNLDNKAQQMVFDLMDNYLKNTMIIVITHDDKMKNRGDKIINLSKLDKEIK